MLISRIYPTARIRGPYFNQKEGRWIVHVAFDNGDLVGLTLARFVMQEHLGRVLTENEHVDHIDENKVNDVLTNLQILTPQENQEKSNRIYAPEVFEVCIWCEEAFILTAKQQANKAYHLRKGKLNAGAFCSQSHASKYNNQFKD